MQHQDSMHHKRMSQEVVSKIQKDDQKENNYFVALIFVASSMRLKQCDQSHTTNTYNAMQRRSARSQSPMSIAARRSQSPMSIAARQRQRPMSLALRDELENDRKTIR